MRQVCHSLALVLASIIPVLSTTATESGANHESRIFYVRQTVGDDANDGLSPDSAWRSFAMLEKAVQAGDTAYVGPGLYREQVTVAHSGTAEKRIAFVADTSGERTGDPPGIVMITGADAVDETRFAPHSTPGVYVAPSPEGRVWGVVEMDGPQYRYKQAFDTVEHLREGVPELAVVAKRPSSFFYDLDAKLVYIHTSDGKPPATHEIELIRRNNGIVTYDKHHVSVIGFTFRHMGSAAIDFEGSSHCIALNNTAYGGWQGIRVFNSTEVLVAANTLFRNGNSGAYFFKESTHVYAVGNVAYENAKGFRWSSDSANGLALENVAFDNREVGIGIEHSTDIRVVRNVLANNAISQLHVMKSRYVSQGNCFESGVGEQLIAHLDHHERYETLAEYQQATQQDTISLEECRRLPKKIDVRRLHAQTLAYAERARNRLAKDGRRAAKAGKDESAE